MKNILRFILVASVITFTLPAFAQKNSVVGKWTIVSLDADGISIDLEKPDAGKNLLAAQMEKQTGSKPDSLVVETAYSEMTSVFASMNLEFTSTGKGIYTVRLRSGELKKDTATYTVDYQKGILNTVSLEEGEEKKDTIQIKFEGDYLTMINNEKKETVKLKRIK